MIYIYRLYTYFLNKKNYSIIYPKLLVYAPGDSFIQNVHLEAACSARLLRDHGIIGDSPTGWIIGDMDSYGNIPYGK